jgi:hypothetical protein
VRVFFTALCKQSWQHIGNKKSDSPYPMENTDNQNTLCQIAHTKLFQSSFAGASGSEIQKPENPVKSRLSGFSKVLLITI